MSSSTVFAQRKETVDPRDHFILSQNRTLRSMSPLMAVDQLFEDFLKEKYPEYSEIAVIQPLEGGVRKKYGDYAFVGVLDLCTKLREDDPFYFDNEGPMKIAHEIKTAFESKGYDMIKQLSLHEAAILTFRLEGCWISKRINEMFSAGINTWAPKFFPQLRRPRAVFIFPTDMMKADLFRSLCIKDVLANIFLYSGVDVGDGVYNDSVLHKVHDRLTNRSGWIIGSSRTYFGPTRPPKKFYTDVSTFCNAFDKQRADFVIYITPHRLREYIEQCHKAAAETNLLRHEWDADTQTCGFRTFYGEQFVSRGLYRDFMCSLPLDVKNLCMDTGYSMERYFQCACKFTCLKRQRMSECTIKLEDLYYNKEENTFGYILRARMLATYYSGRYSSRLDALFAGTERELGLHLVEFTDYVNSAGGTLMPHILCEYICNLSKLFVRYADSELSACQHPCSGNLLGLCKATKLVMGKCFCLLGIDNRVSQSSSWDEEFWSLFYLEDGMPADYHSSSARNEHPKSRFEILSMNVEVAHSSFDVGSIYGDVSVLDTYLSRPDGWMRYGKNDACYVSYYHREWYERTDISNGSYIPLGDPSSLHSIPFATPKVSVMVIATSKDKDETYLIANCKGTPNLNKFWSGDKKLKYGTLKCYGRDGRVLLDFVAIKDAVDTKMTLTVTDAKTDLRVSGSILAYYGDGSLGERGFLGQYHALVFRADQPQCIGILKDKSVPLLRSTLAVPASGNLKLKAHLKDADTGEDIVKGTKEFPASPGSVSVWDMESKSKRGVLKFSVNWLLTSG